MLMRNDMKRFFAGFLLALFVFIQVEKNFHEHAQIESCEIEQGLAVIGKTSYCFICDFQLAAEADLPENASEAFYTIFNCVVPAALVACYPQDPVIFFADRGPPVHMSSLV
jgi:hypothetical protein